MNTFTPISHKDIADRGCYFLDKEQEKRYLSSLNEEFEGLITEKEGDIPIISKQSDDMRKKISGMRLMFLAEMEGKLKQILLAGAERYL